MSAAVQVGKVLQRQKIALLLCGVRALRGHVKKCSRYTGNSSEGVVARVLRATPW